MDETKVKQMIDAAIAEAGKKTDTAIALHVQDAMKDVTKQLTQLQDAVTKPPEKKDGDTAKPLTAEDVAGIVAKAIDGYKAEQAKAAEAASADEKTKGVLKAYVAEKMKDVPPAYQALMPATGDADALAKAEKDVRERMKTELGAAGVKTPDLGVTNTAGAKPPAAGGTGDAEKTGFDLVKEGYAEESVGA